MQLKSKHCKTCRRIFQTTDPRREYCDNACNMVAKRRRKKAKAALPVLKPCAQCGNVFPVAVPNQTHCSRRCAKRQDNLKQQARRKGEEEAKEILRQQQAGKLLEADFEKAAESILSGQTSVDPVRRSAKKTSEPSALDQIRQALYDAEATRRAQIVRSDERCGFDPQEFFANDPCFLRREAAIQEHLASKIQPSGQGPSIRVMQLIRDRESEK